VAVRIRLQRKGAKHMAFFRIVTADSRSPRDGRFIEQLGYYDPLKDPPDIKVDTEKVIDWFRKGALPTETVRSLFSRIGIMQTWHEVRKGTSLDELRHIEDDARKRIEAQAAMQKRTKDGARQKKAEAAEKAPEAPAAPAAEAAPEAAVEPPEAPAVPTAEAAPEAAVEPPAPPEAVENEPAPAEAESQEANAEPAAVEAAGAPESAPTETDAGAEDRKE